VADCVQLPEKEGALCSKTTEPES